MGKRGQWHAGQGLKKTDKSAEGKPGKQGEPRSNMGFTRDGQGEHWYNRT